ncbi:tRNA 5-methoxyuridine(34)/uridine 5-oxyacetic acid(34) synthase CmoB [Candidatus Annandia pinicola]|uniref:tRNA 5-methoxyuridine(34)/uridine 5-oxyacetic acid(34) synthase CmoB n=1 Tax=Candidatus Annandia pinicola TaxID=1345117 RepID=UPI001D033E43|nr:tRNA 5-methoxyuridine(34)/uridine 5-oxyacetic acid(34) synthase CmoB [Candidatus Annandia pinicola]UDG80379.1 tRNA U34 carboxymethyltransferase [Candidatus Annandia pinicola]
MFNFNYFYKTIINTPLHNWLNTLPTQILQWYNNNINNVNFKKLFYILNNIPIVKPKYLDLKNSIIVCNNLKKKKKNIIKKLLFKLLPWKKGPFYLYGINIDSEWRSDWKWSIIKPYVKNIKKDLVLDIGCNNGYYMWRMLGMGSKIIIGIENIPLYFFQFEVIRKLVGNYNNIHMIPLNFNIIKKIEAFNIVFSMGLLYHLKSPFNHIIKIRKNLLNGGELILETLVTLKKDNTIILPIEKYLNMKNIWFIPSIILLKKILIKCKFENIRIINYRYINVKEQRNTKWILNKSCLNIKNKNHNIPLRVIIMATKC